MHGNIQAHNLLLDLAHDITADTEDDTQKKDTKGNELRMTRSLLTTELYMYYVSGQRKGSTSQCRLCTYSR